MKKIIQIILSFSIIISFSACNSKGQKLNSGNAGDTLKKNNSILTDSIEKKEISFIFIGDIMQHGLQIESALNSETGKYDFSNQFKYVKSIFKNTDVVVGNLEVTFGGPPYSGYPKFSSPNSLGEAIKNAGINYLIMSNNHVYDRDKTGFEKTINVVDSLGLKRTGTFLDYADKKKNNPMIIEKNGFKIALFNYGYGVNDNFYEAPNLINFHEKDSIKNDLFKAKSESYDAIIVTLHWGKEYVREPDSLQIDLATFCFENGADIVIGSHSHVINRMEHYTYKSENVNEKEVLVAYSLGNFVSNYGNWRYCDGGTMIEFTLSKEKDKNLKIENPEYQLIWVYRPVKSGKLLYHYVLPFNKSGNNYKMSDSDKIQLNIFLKDSRELLDGQNIGVKEIK